MSALFLFVVIVGFSRSLFLQSYFEFPELPVHLSIHGAVLTSWFLLALAQPVLIKTRRISLHRHFGVFGILLAIAVVVTGVLTLVYRDIPTMDQAPNRAAPNLASLFMFAGCVIFGVLLRKRPDVHKRLMLLASIPIASPALDRFSRLPFLNDFLKPLLGWFPAPVEIAFATVSFFILILAVIAFDLKSMRRVNLGTWLGLSAIFIIAPALTAILTMSGAWEAFVRAFA
jgi:hypothetical protein